MSTPEANSNGNGQSSLTDVIHIVQKVVWAMFALAVVALVAVLVWGIVDLGAAVDEALVVPSAGISVVPYLILAGAAVLGTAAIVALSVIDA